MGGLCEFFDSRGKYKVDLAGEESIEYIYSVGQESRTDIARLDTPFWRPEKQTCVVEDNF
jgi:hypothetical protein